MICQTPFFILGAQRSGTTLLRLMINAHPRLAVPHETGFITEFLGRLPEFGDLGSADNRARLIDVIADYHLVRRGGHIPDKAQVLQAAANVSDFPGLIDAIMSTYAHLQGKQRWGDKTPYYTADIDVLARLFPTAKFVHLVRDGRDVYLSQRGVSWMGKSLPRAAQDWQWKVTIAHKIGQLLGEERFLELRYEDLVREPQRVLTRICEFLSEEFAAAMLEHHRDAERVVPKESLQWHRNSVRGPDASLIGTWRRRMTRSDRIIFEQLAGSALTLHGYDLERLPSTVGSRVRNAVLFGLAR